MKSKRLLLTLLMALLVPWAANAQTSQTLTVYENEASTTIREAPMYVYYFDDFTRAHTVFPKEDLSDMVCGTITSITFYTTSENIPYTTVSSADIYLTEVLNASISAFIDKSSATVVASDYFDFVSDGNNGGMVTITFTTPYEYHGGNLLFGCDNTEDVNYKSIYFKGKSASGASFSGSNGSATPTSGTQRNFLPKTTFTFIPSPFLAPATIAYTNNEPGNTTVSWTAPNTTETVTGYAYHFKKKDVTEWPEYTPVDANVTSVELPNLAFFTEYEFEVKTLYGNNESCSAKKISFTTLDNCMTPENLTITNVTYNSAKFNWTEGFGNGEWKFGYKTGEEEFTYVDVVAADLPLTLNVFEEQRTYNVVVYPLCDPAKTITDQFTTPCAPTTIPSDGWSESFDSYTHTSNSTYTNNLPGCWNYINTTTYSSYKGYPYVYYSTSYSYSPNYHLRFSSSYSSWSNYDPQPQYAILPPMDNLKGKQVTLQARGANTSSTFKIGTMSDPTNANTFEMITEQTGLTTSYEEFMYVIPANCTNKYVVIMIDAASSSRTSNSVYIDDIVIGEAQTCFKPGKPVATLTPGNGSIATLTWTRNVNGTEDAWVLQYGTDANFTDGTYTEVEVTGGVPTKDIDNLTSDETYYARVKPICDTEGNLWSDVSDAFTPTDQYVVTVNNGNTTNGYAPLVTNYKSSYDQMIYTAAQLQSVGINGPCEITKIGFNAATANTIKRLPTLYIGITDKEKFENSTDFVSINDLTLVYSREYSNNTTDPDLWEIKAGWNEFVLDEPFEYDGTSNLVIAMHCGIASNYSSTSFYTNATTNNQVIYARSDNYDPDPVTYEGNWSTYSDTKQVQQQLPSMKMYYEPVTCPRPTGLAMVANSLSAHNVAFTWDYEDGDVFQYAMVQGNLTEINESEYTKTWNAGENFPTWSTLSADKDWSFFLRKNCGGDGFSNPVHVNFHTLIGNPAPTAFHTTDIQQTQVGFDWTNGGGDYEESWMIYLWNESIDINNIADEGLDPSGFRSAGSHPTAIINLTPGTTYYAWVRSNCGSDGMSAWTALEGNSFMTVPTCPAPENLVVTPGSETTDGATITWEGTNDSFVVELGTVDLTSPIVTTLINEGFESGSLPDGWTTTTTGSKNWSVASSVCDGVSPYDESSYAAGTPDGTSDRSEVMYLITPAINLSGAASASLHFYYYQKAWGSDTDPFGVYYRIGTSDTWHELFYSTTSTSSWTEKTITLINLADNYQIGFYRKDNFAYGNAVDNITVTMTSYPVTWTVDGTAPNVEDHGSYTFQGLNDLTPYKARVKGICGSSDQSPYSNVVDFTTLEACPTPKDFVLGAVTSRTAAFSWNGGIATGWKVWVKENGETEYPTNYYEVSTPSKTVENLSSNTSYDVKIVPTCDETKALEVLNAFTTGYGIPFVETFTTSSIPANWALYNGSVTAAFSGTNPSSTTSGWVFDNTNVFGQYHARINIWSSNNNKWLTTPNIDLTTATDASKLYLVFDLAITDFASTDAPGSGEPANGDQFRVLVSTNGGATWTENNSWVWMNEGGDYVYSAIPNTGQTVMLPLAAYASGSVMIAFYAESSGTDFDIHIDNVRVGEVATYQRTIKGHNGGEGGYALVTTPVGTIYSFDMANTNMIANPAVDYDLYYFDQSQDLEWINYKDTENGGNFNLTTGKGYLYANKNTVNLTFTGIAYSGTGVVDLSYNANAEFAGWNLIGNPYATAATLNKPFYKMNETGDAFTAQIEDLTTTIAAMEGVFVQVTESGQSATFTAQTSKGEQQAIAHTNIVLSGNKGKVLDNAIIRFDNGETLGKFSFRENNAKIYIPMEGKDYAVVNAGKTGEIPVSFKAEKNGSYTLSFTSQEVTFSYLHLIDNMTGADVNLMETPSYSFNAQTTDYESRFRLVFSTGSSATGDNFSFINGMGNLCIFGIEGEATVQVMDAIGRMVSSNTFSGSYEQKLNVAPGVYMIRLINGNDVKVQKIVVK